MIQNLPPWNFNNLKPSFNDLESATAVEMVYKLYGKNRELIDDYKKFVQDIQNEIEIFKTSTNQDLECFKTNITKIIHDYIITIDSKIAHQDRVIEENIIYIKENIGTAVIDVVNQMKESGELTEELTNAFDNLRTRVSALEKTKTKLIYNAETESLNFENVEEDI